MRAVRRHVEGARAFLQAEEPLGAGQQVGDRLASRRPRRRCAGTPSSVSQRSQKRKRRFSVTRALTLFFSRASSAFFVASGVSEPAMTWETNAMRLPSGSHFGSGHRQRHLRQALGLAAVHGDHVELGGVVALALRDERQTLPPSGLHAGELSEALLAVRRRGGAARDGHDPDVRRSRGSPPCRRRRPCRRRCVPSGETAGEPTRCTDHMSSTVKGFFSAPRADASAKPIAARPYRRMPPPLFGGVFYGGGAGGLAPPRGRASTRGPSPRPVSWPRWTAPRSSGRRSRCCRPRRSEAAGCWRRDPSPASGARRAPRPGLPRR